jgi:hypothetical protein
MIPAFTTAISRLAYTGVMPRLGPIDSAQTPVKTPMVPPATSDGTEPFWETVNHHRDNRHVRACARGCRSAGIELRSAAHT